MYLDSKTNTLDFKNSSKIQQKFSKFEDEYSEFWQKNDLNSAGSSANQSYLQKYNYIQDILRKH